MSILMRPINKISQMILNGNRMLHIQTMPNNLSTSNLNHEYYEKLYNSSVCNYCKGNPTICSLCKGKGKIYFDGFKEHICDNCKGRCLISCDICGGSGKCHNIF
jgi:hypothetical protein